MALFHTTFSLLHTAAAMTALLIGPFIFLMPKGPVLGHRLLGPIYIAVMLITIVTSFGIYTFSGSFSPFHFFAILSLSQITWGLYMLGRWQRSRDLVYLRGHFRGMTRSYYGLILASIAEGLRFFPWGGREELGIAIILAMLVCIPIGQWLVYRFFEPRVARRYFPALLSSPGMHQ